MIRWIKLAVLLSLTSIRGAQVSRIRDPKKASASRRVSNSGYADNSENSSCMRVLACVAISEFSLRGEFGSSGARESVRPL